MMIRIGVLILGMLAWLAGASLKFAEPARAAPPFLMGTNCNSVVSGPLWTSPDLQADLEALAPGNIRYPGGTVANYWDWRTGNHIPGSGRSPIDGLAHTIPAFLDGLPPHTAVLYCINLARPTPITGVHPDDPTETLTSQETLEAKIADILAAITTFRELHAGPLLIEIGNEFYDGAAGAPDDTGAIYTSGNVALYIDHADQVASAIRARFPGLPIAIIGDTSRPPATGPSAWDQALYDAHASGGLQAIDAITWHWYTGPGVANLQDASDVERSLAQAWRRSDRARAVDIASMPTAWRVWSTEYNTWAPAAEGNPIESTWCGGLFAAIMTITLAADPTVDLLQVHNLQGHPQWAQLGRPAGLRPFGSAMALCYRFARGARQMAPVIIDDLEPATTPSGNPRLVGLHCRHDAGDRLLLLNASQQAITDLDLTSILGTTGNIRICIRNSSAPAAADAQALQITTTETRAAAATAIDLPAFALALIEQDDDRNVHLRHVRDRTWDTTTGRATVTDHDHTTIIDGLDAAASHRFNPLTAATH